MKIEISEDLIHFELFTGKPVTLSFPEMTQIESLIQTIRQIQKVQTIKNLKVET